MFDRAELYGSRGVDYPDNAERFALIAGRFWRRRSSWACRRSSMCMTGRRRDSRVPATVYSADTALEHAAVVLTIHNAAYQGAFPPVTTERLLFPWEIFTMDKVEQFNTFNFLKGGWCTRRC